MNKIESYSILDVKESDPVLEKHRKDVLEKYLEYGVIKLQEFKDQGKTIEDVLEQAKTVLWYIKNQRMEHIQDELGL
ncbi:MAG: hypothetical protein KKC68_03945 [Candidatus Thermoplasmatota archaeon]|nr:hypothetical protein [Candidatus Thermoplasmatota archaeon]MBU1940903.1 hypothetical protein [Candidatus Thermoplasmatota archaeon]